ncbi:MAG: hypothetical protein PHE55_18145 [Methylococcaceae bacterium]|nr:hypothetical protein [Methylococcaceae bacterium]
MKFRMMQAIGVFVLAGAFCASASAEVALKDNAEILGKWTLESVSPSLDKPRIPENRTWEFRTDGTIFTSGFNRHLGGENSQEFKYRVADGKIKVEKPGSSKTLDYTVHEKSGDTMILHGGLEGFYFFKKK